MRRLQVSPRDGDEIGTRWRPVNRRIAGRPEALSRFVGVLSPELESLRLSISLIYIYTYFFFFTVVKRSTRELKRGEMFREEVRVTYTSA